MAEDRDRPLSTSDIAGVERDERTDGPATAVQEEPRVVTPAPGREGVADSDRAAPLFANDETQGYRTRWDAIQTGFVDEPRRAVEEADALVADVMKRLAESFAKERSALESQWDRGDKISTEDLRLALRRYRSFFQRLLSI